MNNYSYTYEVLPETEAAKAHGIELATLKDFKRFVEGLRLTPVFLIVDEAKQVTRFAVRHEGILVQLASAGFKTTEDTIVAAQHNFPGAPIYYDALQKGYTSHEEYQLAMKTGVPNLAEFTEMKSKGYIKGFTELVENNKLQAVPELADITDPYRLFTYCKEKGFSGYAHFYEAFEKGFTDAQTYTIASEKKFKSKADFDSGNASHFVHGMDYELAKGWKVRDQQDGHNFFALYSLNHHAGLSFDQRLMLILLSKLPPLKKVPVAKIATLFEQEKYIYRYPDTGEMPPWFVSSFTGTDSIIEFLATFNDPKEFGSYDSAENCFVTVGLPQRKVLIDGNQVAFNSTDMNREPYLNNLLRMVKKLKELGFTDIKISCDRGLKKQAKDPELLPELEAYMLEAPAGTVYINWVITNVRTFLCLLISNYTFDPIKRNDSWVRDNIDYYRLGYEMNKKKIRLGDME